MVGNALRHDLQETLIEGRSCKGTRKERMDVWLTFSLISFQMIRVI